MPPPLLSSMFGALVFFITMVLTNAGTIPLPAYPLAVRSPWLSAWAKGDAAQDMPSAQATFWNGISLGWEVMARVDDSVYTLFGFPRGVDGAGKAFQRSINFTSTHTTVLLEAGAAEFVLDFFSPVSPKNLLRHSLPYSYLTVTAIANGADIQIFSAIDETWSAQMGNVTTNLSNHGDTFMYIMNNPNEISFEVKENMAAWGSVVYATRPSNTSKISVQCGDATQVYYDFVVDNGILQGISTACDGGNSSIFAYSHDLGRVTGSDAVTFAIGQTRNEVVEYIGFIRTSYHQAKYKMIPEAVSAFLDDYDDALAEASVSDEYMRTKASKLSSNYADIVEASVRQAFGAMEVTIPAADWDTSNPMVFLKEISSDGNVNTIDVIYPTFPILYELAPEWIKYLMEPILAYLVSPGAWNLPYIVHDLGRRYPVAGGYDNDTVEFILGRPEFMPLDSTGSAMVLLYAYQILTGDKAYAQQYSNLLRTYADFLWSNGTAGIAQLSTVDALIMSENQTMLVVQSAIGLTAYGAMSGNENYTRRGLELADLMYTQGQGLDSERTHFIFNYGPDANDASWSVIFPFFVDKLLELDTFPAAAYNMMSEWYESQFDTYGLPYGKNLRWGITDWNMWAAATSSVSVRTSIIDKTHAFLTLVTNTRPFQTKYNVRTGQAVANIARSTVGSNFALMNLHEVAAAGDVASTAESAMSAAAGLGELNPLGWVGRMLRSGRRKSRGVGRGRRGQVDL